MSIYTLAQFLFKAGLLKRFREEVAPYLVYLRRVLGDGFFTDTEGDGVFLSHAAKVWRGGIGSDDSLCWFKQEHESAERMRSEDTEEKARGNFSNYKSEIEELNFGRVKRHLLQIEAGLLGASHKVGARASDLVDLRASTAAPPLAPFSALLGNHRVVVGEQGQVGGYEHSTRQYHAPSAGEVDLFPKEILDKALEEFASLGAYPSNSHLILVGRNFKRVLSGGSSVMPMGFQSEEEEAYAAHHNLSPYRYVGLPDQALRPPVRLSWLMPDDTVYVLSSEKIALLATSLCEVWTNESDVRVIGLKSRIHHSLLHMFDILLGWEMEKHHAAFLGVKDEEQISLTRPA